MTPVAEKLNMNPKKILIIKPSSFGDIIQALPAAARLKGTWPAAEISWLVNSQYGRLLENNPCIDHLIFFERHLWKNKGENFLKALSSFLRLCRYMRARRFDTVLDLQGLFRSGFFSAVTGASVRAGFANAREVAHLFYNRRIDLPEEEMHSVDRYLLLPAALGCTENEVNFPLGIGGEAEAWAEQFLDQEGSPKDAPRVGLSPFARWKTKSWPREYFARLGDLISASGATVVIVGGAEEERKNIASLMKHRAITSAGTGDPLKLAAVLKRLHVLVTNDTGPMHLAAAVGTAVVALFGPTNPSRTGPYGEKHRVICAPVDCRPCYRRECDKEENCMRAISVEKVREAVEGIITLRHREHRAPR